MRRRTGIAVVCLALLVPLLWGALSSAAVPTGERACGHGSLTLLQGAGSSVGPGPCPGIRPGARVDVGGGWCTLNFVVTDGTDRYIGTAAHCVEPGQRVRLWGQWWAFGTVVAQDNTGDWAFIRIDDEDLDQVDPTMCGWAGPHTGPTGANVARPFVGDVVLHYGHAVDLGDHDATRGRSGVATDRAQPLFGGHYFAFVGAVQGGDSGSPVRMASGEAAGIVSAVLTGVPTPGPTGSVVVAGRFDLALAGLEAALDQDVSLVEGLEPVQALTSP